MRVTMFTPEQSYGFAKNSETGSQCFFHLANFSWLRGYMDPLPVVGECVLVEYDPEKPLKGNAPRASRVTRLSQPPQHLGTVDSFDVQRGYGFIIAENGTSFYLHRSDVVENLIPVVGKRVQFWEGFKRNKPRACYCEVRESKF